MCKKQTAVSHSSTESEIISLDSGLRLDGLPALDRISLDSKIQIKYIDTKNQLADIKHEISHVMSGIIC